MNRLIENLYEQPFISTERRVREPQLSPAAQELKEAEAERYRDILWIMARDGRGARDND